MLEDDGLSNDDEHWHECGISESTSVKVYHASVLDRARLA
jgi:hypothetical protein